MSVEAIARTIQFILAPVVMITSCAILAGGILTRYAEINDRMRALTRERLELLRTADGQLASAVALDDAFKSERLAEIDAQLPSLLYRHSLVHHAALFIYFAILIFVVNMLAIALAEIPDSARLATVALAIFILGTIALLIGVVLIAVELRISDAAVRYEVLRVMRLGK